ncbi:hypothetical protein FACS1894188_05350 [Clostridia bacterium]|nr:hypothetical protein FACS1894188_05350 [Clostridia bacterium]
MDNIEQLMKFLPKEYIADCRDCGTVKRLREFRSVKDLMKVNLVYLYKGLSLVETVTYASVSGIAEISDTAFMKRFRNSKEWFERISEQLQIPERSGYDKPEDFNEYRVIAVDASDIVQKGKAHNEFHLHYAYDIFKMSTAECKCIA